ncbi:queuine tRNA-ribosyltransferase family protein [Lactobacillus sp. Marseille-P7033]|nr:queuine tRNA-ribosyltransferase family protein [Lactobacillus sp. Marseille-P7033]NGC77971.1 tRNA-guanine transglycosylase [Limosilactobacillus reuteri]
MSSIKFTIKDNDGTARTGCLQVNGRQIETPALVYTGNELMKLAPAQLEHAGVRALKTAGLMRWLKYNSTIEKLGDLHQLFHWQGLLMIDLQNDYAYRLAKPRGKKRDGVRFHDPATGQLKFWQPETALHVQQDLGADIFQSFDRSTDYYAPVDDLEAGVEQTANWLAVNTPVKEQAFGTVAGGGLKKLRKDSVQAVDQAGLAGYRLSGIPVNLNNAEFKRIINEIVPLLSPIQPRYLATAITLGQMLEAVLSGVDLIDSDLAAKKAANGIVLVGDRLTPLHLDREHFSFDSQPIDNQCSCATCQAGYSRALLHSLVADHSFYGEQLLLQHNLFTLNKLMNDLRQAIKNHQIKRFVQELL